MKFQLISLSMLVLALWLTGCHHHEDMVHDTESMKKGIQEYFKCEDIERTGSNYSDSHKSLSFHLYDCPFANSPEEIETAVADLWKHVPVAPTIDHVHLKLYDKDRNMLQALDVRLGKVEWE